MANSLQELNTSQALEEWAVQIKECRNSGLTVREWCKSKGINTHKFYYWQKKLFITLSGQKTTEFAELPLPENPQYPCSQEVIAKITINGIAVEVFGNASHTQIAMLLTALKQC